MAKKVNNYLQSGSSMFSGAREHAERMEEWLGKLLAQVHASPEIQFPVTLILPNHTKLSIWSKSMLTRVISLIEEDWVTMGCMRHSTAKKVGPWMMPWVPGGGIMFVYVRGSAGCTRAPLGKFQSRYRE